jgi:hypothetical protein
MRSSCWSRLSTSMLHRYGGRSLHSSMSCRSVHPFPAQLTNGMPHGSCCGVAQVKMAGGKCVYVPLRPPDDSHPNWHLCFDEFRAAFTSKTRCVGHSPTPSHRPSHA